MSTKCIKDVIGTYCGKFVTMDNTTVFSSRGESYDRARPGYPEALIDYLYTNQFFSDASAIADIGSGTGKFAQQLLDRGSRVFCVEPNEEMRQIAERKLHQYSGFISVNGTASFTGIKEKVDAVTAAQAFHWFDRSAFREECRRLLYPGGKVHLIWNFRLPDDEITNTCWEIFQRYCPNFPGFNTRTKEDDPRIYDFFGGYCEKTEFDNPLRYDEALFIDRYLSSSYSLKKEETGYDACLEEVRCLFRQFSRDGEVLVSNKAVCYSGYV